MNVRLLTAGTRDGAAALPTDPNLARLLMLLGRANGTPFTISALRDSGIVTPGQAIYELQLAGYTIDRVPIHRADGHTGFAYRLYRAHQEALAELDLAGGNGR